MNQQESMLFMGTPSGINSQVEFPKVPLIDINKVKGAGNGGASLTPSNQRLKMLKYRNNNNAGGLGEDVRKLKPKRAITTMSPFAMTFGGDKDIPQDKVKKGKGEKKVLRHKRTISSD